jgi:hypothetical protein
MMTTKRQQKEILRLNNCILVYLTELDSGSKDLKDFKRPETLSERPQTLKKNSKIFSKRTQKNSTDVKFVLL